MSEFSTNEEKNDTPGSNSEVVLAEPVKKTSAPSRIAAPASISGAPPSGQVSSRFVRAKFTPLLRAGNMWYLLPAFLECTIANDQLAFFADGAIFCLHIFQVCKTGII